MTLSGGGKWKGRKKGTRRHWLDLMAFIAEGKAWGRCSCRADSTCQNNEVKPGGEGKRGPVEESREEETILLRKSGEYQAQGEGKKKLGRKELSGRGRRKKESRYCLTSIWNNKGGRSSLKGRGGFANQIKVDERGCCEKRK